VRRFRSLLPSRFLGRFARSRDGATAVELALVSVPLFALTMGTLELMVLMLVAATQETATESAGRMIRTGEFQTATAHSSADFKGLVCNRMGWLSARCNTDLTVDVRVFNDFATLAANQGMTGQNFNAGNACFAPGQPGDIVLVRTYLAWPLFAPIIDAVYANMGGGRTLLSSATAFRNEPYNSNPAGGAAC